MLRALPEVRAGRRLSAAWGEDFSRGRPGGFVLSGTLTATPGLPKPRCQPLCLDFLQVRARQTYKLSLGGVFVVDCEGG